ncbi:MAG TPA: aspartate--tRNA ligase [Candidatus Saccharimonadales bacterium]|nr:aspartate--tRNA ligase [Candidatus Saccharimonadales bacterium]
MSEKQRAKRIYISDLLDKVNESVEVYGWVNSRRDHGKIVFFDLRDSSGLLQVVITPKNEEVYTLANTLTTEDVIKVSGKVGLRPEANLNKDLKTGKIELAAEKIEVVGKAKELPIPIEGEGYDIDEAARLHYRYIDLRRARLQKNLKQRSALANQIRSFLTEEKFIEIETPYLSKTTPEGARDFLVPSRLQKGKFYALAQSPQQYKQLLMISGVDRYFQLSRAFRDEDLRADRQFEHTQVDIEMAFVEREDVLGLIEKMMTEIAEASGKKITQKPFPRYSFKEAQKKFGADKFDERKNKEDKEELSFAFVIDFPLFEYNEEEKRWTFSHNPFTAPNPEDLEKLTKEKEIDKIGSLQYDLVCNGLELASGSIRIHNPETQRQVFKIMGYSEEEIEKDFGHILEAYEYGAPVHGGIAIGFDRLSAVFAGEKSIREVVAFPVNSSGVTSVMDAPGEVSEKTLKDLDLKKIASKE